MPDQVKPRSRITLGDREEQWVKLVDDFATVSTALSSPAEYIEVTTLDQAGKAVRTLLKKTVVVRLEHLGD